jgi:Zn-dependent protease with chaperone function
VFFVLGISIVLALMLVVNSLASVLAGLVWRLSRRRINRWAPANKAEALFLLRALPAFFGAVCVLLLFAPAYLTHEPRDGHEDVSIKLAVVAGLAGIGIAVALVRGIAAWRATSRLAADWLRHAQPISIEKINIPAYEIEHRFPLIAVVGSLRPRLFIAKQVLQTLSSDELCAALEHEAGHIMARDNLKRGLMRACRDVLMIVPFGQRIDRAWVDASEAAADEYAARGRRKTGLDLASAMVKIARMIPAGTRPTMMAGAFLIGDDDKIGFKRRIRRLIQLANSPAIEVNPKGFSKILKWLPIVLMFMVIGLTATQPHVLATVHQFIEHAVYILD